MSGSRLALSRPPPRLFHQSASECLPRQRSFFTSNPYLSRDDPSAEPASLAPPSSSPAKRKPARATTAAAAKTSLRRVALIAQHPEHNTTTTSGQQPPAAATDYSTVVSAVCLAEGFHMPTVLSILSSGFDMDPDGTGFDASEVVHARTGGGGDVFVFPSGTLVTWAVAPGPAADLAQQLLPAAEDVHPLVLREAEDLDFTRDAARATSVLRGDVIVLGSSSSSRLGTTLAQIAFSSGLARSTKLGVLETALASYFESTRAVPALLAAGGRRHVPLSRRFILRKTGELLALRARLNHYSELTDALPDLFWDSRSELGLDGYYEQVGRALDVGVRIRALNQKMDYAQEIATVLREMASERHGTRLEWIIIALIAVEVGFEMRHIVREWTHEHGSGGVTV